MPEAELLMNINKALTRKAMEQSLHTRTLPKRDFLDPSPRTFPKAVHSHATGDQVFPREMPMPEPVITSCGIQ